MRELPILVLKQETPTLVVGLEVRAGQNGATLHPQGCLRALMLTVFHRTTKDAAAKILQGGFRDITSRYLTDREWSGVWVSDRPLDNSEGASGEALLQIDIAEDLLTAFEWVEEGKPFREWLVPAAVLNDAGTVRLLDESAD